MFWEQDPSFRIAAKYQTPAAVFNDENIANIKYETTVFFQIPNKSPRQYTQELGALTMQSGDVYDKQQFDEIFIEK